MKSQVNFLFNTFTYLYSDYAIFTDYVQGVSADFNLLFADLRSQKLERKSEYLRDQVWLDQTCTLGYSVAGTWNNLSYKNDPTTTTAVHVGGHRCVNIRVGFFK